MKAVTQPDRFKVLDATHQQIHQNLAALAELLPQIEGGGENKAVRQQVAAVEAFFSGTSRQHHQEEEKNIFPNLLQSPDKELVQAVQTLQQDHHWIELNWSELAPMLRAIAQGEDWVDMAELRHGIEVFLNLCHDHIVLEETLIYPQARAQLAVEMAGRALRMAQ